MIYAMNTPLTDFITEGPISTKIHSYNHMIFRLPSLQSKDCGIKCHTQYIFKLEYRNGVSHNYQRCLNVEFKY